MINVSKLLKKKSWTGSELGRLQLADTLKVLDTAKPGNRSKKQIINREDFKKMLNTLEDPNELQIYNGYIAIHEWFRISYAGAAAEEQSAHLNFYIFDQAISNAIVAEDIYEALFKIPVEITHDLQSPLNIIGLEGYFESEENTDNIDYIKTARKRLLNSYYFIKGWNTALKLIADQFDIEEILIAQRNVKYLEENLERYNNKVNMLIDKINNSDYTKAELKEKKVKVLKKLISPISFEEIIIPADKIEEAQKNMQDFAAFKDDSKDIRRVLCYISKK